MKEPFKFSYIDGSDQVAVVEIDKSRDDGWRVHVNKCGRRFEDLIIILHPYGPAPLLQAKVPVGIAFVQEILYALQALKTSPTQRRQNAFDFEAGRTYVRHQFEDRMLTQFNHFKCISLETTTENKVINFQEVDLEGNPIGPPVSFPAILCVERITQTQSGHHRHTIWNLAY